MNKRGIIKILIIIIWLILIFMFSNQNANNSLDLSKNFIYKIVEIINGKALTEIEKKNITYKYIYYVRKSAHFFLYFTLSFLIFILLKDIIRINFKIWLIPIMCCCLYAITDEFHQSFVVGRTARIFDVFVDTSGAAISSSIMYIIYKHKNKKEKSLQE